MTRFGHDGFGGQIAFGDAASGVGFVRSYYSETSPLGNDLVAAALNCSG